MKKCIFLLFVFLLSSHNYLLSLEKVRLHSISQIINLNEPIYIELELDNINNNNDMHTFSCRLTIPAKKISYIFTKNIIFGSDSKCKVGLYVLSDKSGNLFFNKPETANLNIEIYLDRKKLDIVKQVKVKPSEQNNKLSVFLKDTSPLLISNINELINCKSDTDLLNTLKLTKKEDVNNFIKNYQSKRLSANAKRYFDLFCAKYHLALFMRNFWDNGGEWTDELAHDKNLRKAILYFEDLIDQHESLEYETAYFLGYCYLYAKNFKKANSAFHTIMKKGCYSDIVKSAVFFSNKIADSNKQTEKDSEQKQSNLNNNDKM